MDPVDPIVEQSLVETDREDVLPDLLAHRDRLSWLERANIATIRRGFDSAPLSATLGFLQRKIGASWVYHCSKHLQSCHGLERIPPWNDLGGFILVSNHRSYFDLFVITQVLIRNGMMNRMLFPVRSAFYYDHPLGFLVNGAMSFWSMYPPIFRDRRRAALNRVALDEVASFVERKGFSVGIHPEGTRKKDDDPYTFLPAQSGVGRLIHRCRRPVLPAFIHGLGNDVAAQVRGNFKRNGTPIVLVFGEPIHFGDLLERPATSRLHRAIAERCLEVIGALGQQEKQLRAALFAT